MTVKGWKLKKILRLDEHEKVNEYGRVRGGEGEKREVGRQRVTSSG
jgi:hypothetical protein